MLTKSGNVSAHIPTNGTKDSHYIRVGAAFTDDEGRIVIKIDSLPLPNSNWQGWLNIFPLDKIQEK